jgi:hypothetical protein
MISFIITIEKPASRNQVKVALQKRHTGKQIHKDRRLKRLNKNSWKHEVW